MYVPDELTLAVCLQRLGILLVFGLFMLLGIYAVRLFGPDKEALKAIEQSVTSQLEDKSSQWDRQYPYGYKIIALTDQEIIHTAYDTFTPDFEINWRELSVTKIRADQLQSSAEKIRIVAPRIKCLSEDVSSRSTVTVTISSNKGMKASLVKFGRFDFGMEVVENTDGKIYCLFGLRQK